MVASIVTLIAIAILVKLGFWQLDRAQQKQKLFADFAQAQAMQARPLAQRLSSTTQLTRFELVSITGRFDTQRYFLIDNQMVDGQPGYHVIALLKSQQLRERLPVNLGWIKAPRSRAEIPTVELPQQELTLEGLVRIPQANQFISQVFEEQQTAWPRRVQEFIPQTISEYTGIELKPYELLLVSPQLKGFRQQWEPQVMEPAKHQAYAVQWFSLAIACLVVYLVVLYKLNKTKQEETP
ncbi:SURF1 family protein [Idiomarina sp. MD25a]|uniref:SURF1 family protein n=1 Tax=Idiomarina sp. MD25a TaxID=1889913 RepID=UPI001C0DE6E4|nr:SURF1 family protein [Idiomarina sp. MD25a]